MDGKMSAKGAAAERRALECMAAVEGEDTPL